MQLRAIWGSKLCSLKTLLNSFAFVITWFICFSHIQAENMIAHKDEIYSRPKRTWFLTEKEKKLAAKAAKVYC